MPPIPPPRPTDADLPRLDAEALRHLVTRPDLVRLLWNRSRRVATEEALLTLYGERATEHTALVTQQALATSISSIASAFDATRRENGMPSDEAQRILDTVRLIVGFDLGPEDFHSELQYVLLHATLLAALVLLLHSRAQVEDVYRSEVDFVREVFTSADEQVSRLRVEGIAAIKRVVRVLFRASQKREAWKAGRAEALHLADAFRLKYPVKELMKNLVEQLTLVNGTLPNLWMHVKHREDTRGITRDRGGLGGRSHKIPVGDRLPDFFSDAEDGSEIHEAEDDDDMAFPPDDERATEREEEISRRDAESEMEKRYVPSSVHHDEHEGAYNDMYGRAPPTKKMRTWTQNTRVFRRSLRMSRSQPDRRAQMNDIKLRRRVSKRISYDEQSSHSKTSSDSRMAKELDSMDPGLFDAEEGDSETTSTQHVARHGRVRGSKSRKKLSQGNTRVDNIVDGLSDRNDSPPNAKEEGSDGAEEDEVDDVARSRIGGIGGESIRELHEASSRLDRVSIPDPLPLALDDAARARPRTRRNFVLDYEPDNTARRASPISGVEPPMQRQKRLRATLQKTPPSKNVKSKDSRECPSGLGGKIPRSGRYQPYEDDLLIEGLRKYGWGMWAMISQNFGQGRYSRAPMSLKDRARTLELDHKKYPLPPNTTKKGRPTELDRLTPLKHNQSAEEVDSSDPSDVDEDEANNNN